MDAPNRIAYRQSHVFQSTNNPYKLEFTLNNRALKKVLEV